MKKERPLAAGALFLTVDKPRLPRKFQMHVLATLAVSAHLSDGDSRHDFCAGRPEKRATVSSATNLHARFAQAMFNSIGRVL